MKINETQLRKIIQESVKNVLKESDGEFIPHGYSADCNFGGKEIQLSNNGEMARIRTNYDGQPDKPTRWLKINFTKEGVAYVMFKGKRMRLDNFLRIN